MFAHCELLYLDDETNQIAPIREATSSFHLLACPISYRSHDIYDVIFCTEAREKSRVFATNLEFETGPRGGGTQGNRPTRRAALKGRFVIVQLVHCKGRKLQNCTVE